MRKNETNRWMALVATLALAGACGGKAEAPKPGDNPDKAPIAGESGTADPAATGDETDKKKTDGPGVAAPSAADLAKDPMGAMLDLHEAMLNTIEAHKSDPAAANAALKTFLADKGAAFDEVGKAMKALQADPAKGMEMVQGKMERTMTVMKRMADLARGNSALMDDQFLGALARLSGRGDDAVEEMRASMKALSAADMPEMPDLDELKAKLGDLDDLKAKLGDLGEMGEGLDLDKLKLELGDLGGELKDLDKALEALGKDGEGLELNLDKLLGGGDDDDSSPLNDEEAKLLDEALLHQEKIMDALVDNKDDTDKAKAALLQYVGANAEAMERMGKLQEVLQGKLKDDPSAAMRVFNKYSGRMQKLAQRAMEAGPIMQKVMSDPEVMKAMEKFRMGP